MPVSRAETVGAFNAEVDTVNLHRPTVRPRKLAIVPARSSLSGTVCTARRNMLATSRCIVCGNIAVCWLTARYH